MTARELVVQGGLCEPDDGSAVSKPVLTIAFVVARGVEVVEDEDEVEVDDMDVGVSVGGGEVVAEEKEVEVEVDEVGCVDVGDVDVDVELNVELDEDVSLVTNVEVCVAVESSVVEEREDDDVLTSV